MQKIIVIISFIFIHYSAFSSQWFCKEGASSRRDNTYEVCGIGNEDSETNSRKEALKNAFDEFDLVCNKSDDCKGKYKQVSPLRTDCELTGDKYKCYRAFYIIVDPSKNSSSLENKDLAKELEKKENEIKSIQEKYGIVFAEKFRVDKELEEIKLQNIELQKKIEENENYIDKNKILANKLSNLDKLSDEIRNKIKSKNQLVESYIKKGMSVAEVNNLLSIRIPKKYGGDYLFGTYQIGFDYANHVVYHVCKMNYQGCLNIEP